MKYTVTCICGHQEEMDLYGKDEQRKKAIKAVESNYCSVCIRNRSLQLLTDDIAAGMCDLDGSDRQRPYAASIRHNQWDKVISWVNDYITHIDISLSQKDISAKEKAALQSDAEMNLECAKKTLANNKSSKWWIDRKGLSPSEMFEAMQSWAKNPAPTLECTSCPQRGCDAKVRGDSRCLGLRSAAHAVN